jgi:hypothetical protein
VLDCRAKRTITAARIRGNSGRWRDKLIDAAHGNREGTTVPLRASSEA